MKTSVHFGKGNATHNDRTYDKESHDIIKITSKDDHNKSKTFLENEIEKYKNLYEERRLTINEKYIKHGEPKKCIKSIEDYYKKNQPKELILQVGNIKESIDPKILIGAVLETIAYIKNKGIEILDAVVHNDEATPHAHVRMTFPYEKNGITEPNANKNLEKAGYGLPNPDKEISRYNNRMVSLSNDVRERFISICQEKGLEIDTKASDEHVRSLSVHDYKLEQDKNMNFLEELKFDKKQKTVNNLIERLNRGDVDIKKIEEILNEPTLLERTKEKDLEIFGRR